MRTGHETLGLMLYLVIGCFDPARLWANHDLVFHKITTDQGLSHNTVYTIVQDQKGFLWFGTREGLNRYDGNNIVTYYADPDDRSSLVSNSITALEAGSDGLIYIGTTQGLNVYNNRTRTFTRIQFRGSTPGYVNRIVRVSDGSLLICTNKGLFIKRTAQEDLSPLIGNVNITDLFEYRKGVFWISSLQKMMLINGYGEVIKEYSALPNRSNQEISLSHNISCLYRDSSGEIWLGTKKNGLFKYDLEKDEFKPVLTKHRLNPLEVNIVRAISEDEQKRLWIGTETGLFVYDRASSQFQRYTQSFDQSPKSLNDKAIYSIYKSKEGIMWLGTYFGGINIVLPWEKGFKTLAADGGLRQLSGKAVSDIMQDSYGKMWIATEDGGVSIWDKIHDTFQYLRNEPGKNGLSVDNVHALYEDTDHTIWIGTFLGGLNLYRPRTRHTKVFKGAQQETASFANNMVYAIHRDKEGNLWIGTQAGLSLFDEKQKTYVPFKPEVFQGKFIYEIYEQQSGELWFCLMNSDSLYHYHPATGKLQGYKYNGPGFPAVNHGVISALEDSQGRMWFGTVDKGLLQLDRSNGSFITYTKEDGLPNNYVYGILEDHKGCLWLSTNKGLSKFDVTHRTFINYDISHGLPNNQFNFKSAFKNDQGWMFFGTIDGLCYFHPDSLILNDTPPDIYLSDLKLFNRSVPIGKGSILEHNIDVTTAITLKYAQNVITLEFAAINYFSPGHNQYAYYLEGFEEGWNYVDSKRSATYTNLSPGRYVFKVKAANNDGVWSEHVKQLEVNILPPFWLSKWAMFLYMLLIALLIILYRAFLNYRNKEKMAIQIERLEKEKIKEINWHKINFFTYISHEFKTPLTLIMASIDKFLRDKSVNKEDNLGYWSIKRNAKRLHFLIDQLMEFRKVETDHAQINYVKGDIVLFLKDTFAAFFPLFSKKQIDFYFNSNTTEFATYFDRDKLEKIITNLVANATKYTSEGGVIEMEVEVKRNEMQEADKIKITIRDTGEGIAPEELENIFTSYYQTEHGKKSGSGTGIGLALVKSLVDFLKGKIEIESTLYSGTQATITLPLPRQIEHDRVAKIEGNKSVDIDHELTLLPHPGTEDEPVGAAYPEYKLMIVEDNQEMADFLHRHLCKFYKIVKADNGKRALEKIKNSAPDIIVSDVMMPKMDGIELCQRIKSDINISHIPVIFLTAKTTIENRLEGLDVGADAYIDKPFSLKELELTIKNLLESRNKLKNHFLKFGHIKDLDTSFTNRDQDFILKLAGIVERHLDDTAFNITRFTQEAGVSRTLLHLKLKKLVNLSASEFIRTIRLRKATELLEKTDYSVSEIAYKVGYSDANYFSRSFKEMYHVNPTEYKQNPEAAKV